MSCPGVGLIEFLTGELSPQETDQVLSHLETCTECRERLRIMVALQADSVAESTTRVKRDQEKGKPGRIISFLLAAAALLLLALSPFFKTVWQESNPSGAAPTAQLATNRPYPSFPLVTRSSGSSEPALNPRTRAWQHYSQGHFQEALALLEMLEEEEDTLFFRGVCHYLLGHDKPALDLLQRAAEKDSRWRRPALWYKANLNLRRGDIEQARDVLEHLRRETGEFRQEAEALLRQLQP